MFAQVVLDRYDARAKPEPRAAFAWPEQDRTVGEENRAKAALQTMPLSASALR
jgi:hypothetical protein